MKIKTITSHDVYNFGASLQAYALRQYLQQQGHDVEIIDYKPDYLTFNLWEIGPRWSKNIFLKLLYYGYVVPKRLLLKKRRDRFDQFAQEMLALTATRYKTFDELKENPPKAEIYFAGSDQIWNTIVDNGKDPAFYLNFAPHDSIKASYAASFSVSEIEEALKPQIKSYLSQLDFISVREKSGLKILEDLGFKNGVNVADPVFLLNKEHWDDIAKCPIDSNIKYIFIYDQENNNAIKESALKLAKQNNLKIVAIEALYPMSYADIKIRDAGPQEFLGLIKNSTISLTNSFHCVVFSLIFQNQFYLYPRSHMKVNSRMVDLLSLLGLQNRIFIDTLQLRIDKIDYREINKQLESYIEISKQYIESVLNYAADKKGQEN